jgi:hypothetical protein
LADFSKRHVAVFAVVFGAIGGIWLLNNSSALLGAPTVYLTPETKSVNPGDSVTFEVRMNSGTTNVNAVQADFTYPEDKLEFGAIDGAGSAFATVAPSTGGSGKVSIARGNIDPVSGDKLIAKVTFTVKAATSGTAELKFATGTALLDAATNADLLGSTDKTTGSTLTIGGASNPNPTPNPNPDAAKVKLVPSSTSVAPNQDFTVEVRMNSGTVEVNAIQADFSYPADKLQFVSIDGTGSAFTTEAPSTGAAGKVSIARGNIQPVSGDKLVAKVTFKALAAGSAQLSFVNGTALLKASDNTDIIGGLTNTAGTTITVGTGGNPNPNPNPPAPNPNPPNPPGPNPNPNPGTGVLYMQPGAVNAALNANFTVEIRSRSGTTPVNAVQADFSYPGDKLQFISIDGTGSAYATEAPSTGGSGKVSIARGNIQPVTGDALIAKVTFKALAAGSAPLTFLNGTVLLRSSDNTDIIGGIANTDGSTVTIGSGGNPNPNPPGPNPNPTPNKGDMNGDGSVNFEDLAMFLLRWASTDTNADFDKDGRVTIYDLSILLSNYGN